MIKILQNGIKHSDGGYTPCFYSMGNSLKHSKDCITITARDYENLPDELGKVQNDSDYMTDYFDNDRVYLEPGDKYYNEALAAYNKRRVADSKRWLKHDEKRLAKELASGCCYPATIANLKENIENYKQIINALSA